MEAELELQPLVKNIPMIAAVLQANPAPRLPDRAEISRELALIPSTAVAVVEEEDPELDELADKHVAMLLSVKPQDFDGREQRRAAVEQMGRSLQEEAVAHSSQMLDKPVRNLSVLNGGGASVAKDLVAFTAKIRENNPNDWNFDQNWWGRLWHQVPIVGEKVEQYFMQFQSARSVIDEIGKSLRNGVGILERNNQILGEDQSYMRTLTFKFQRLIGLGTRMDPRLIKAAEQYPSTNEIRRFIEEELLFGLRQRLIDLGQQLTVNQQGVMAVEMLRRTNAELIRGVHRGLNVTMMAIQYGVLVALALADQGIIADQIRRANELASDLTLGTSKRLHETTAEIHKAAASATLDMKKLGESWTYVTNTWDEMTTFRRDALPAMAQVIGELHDMNEKGEKVIKQMEAGNALRAQIQINLE